MLFSLKHTKIEKKKLETTGYFCKKITEPFKLNPTVFKQRFTHNQFFKQMLKKNYNTCDYKNIATYLYYTMLTVK